MTNLKENGVVVQSLTESILGSKRGLDHVPGLMRRVIQENMWQSRVFRQTGEVIEFERFTDFVTHRHYEGLGITTEALLELCRADSEVYEMVRKMIEGEVSIGNHGGINQYNSEGVITPSVKTERGTSNRQYIIARLKRDGHEELAEQVIRKEITAKKAAEMTGIRRAYVTVEAGNVYSVLAVIKSTFTDEQIQELITKLSE